VNRNIKEITMGAYTTLCRDYGRVEKLLRFLEDHHLEQPALAELAAAAGLSEFHLQRLFSRWVGISPKRFLQYLTKEHAKKLIADSGSLLDTTYASGLSSSGRLHDLFVSCEAVTPGEYKQRGRGLEIRFGFYPSPFGECLLAVTDRGLCALTFVQDEDREAPLAELTRQWPRAAIRRDPKAADGLLDRIFGFPGDHAPAPLHLFVKGTNFQLKVWEALLKIPLGKAVTYEDIARHVGLPNAARAVGNAVGRNPIPFLIPCHRVIRKMGAFGHYGGGAARKKAMLVWEASLVDGPSEAPLTAGRAGRRHHPRVDRS
jgi:AraC family transcriptional regulator of adaptative response/methylated-DNA-[protein]-cysteine methyltransferase